MRLLMTHSLSVPPGQSIPTVILPMREYVQPKSQTLCIIVKKGHLVHLREDSNT